MSLFVSHSNEILNIGEKATGLLDRLSGGIIDEVLDFIQEDKLSDRLGALSSSERDEIKDFFGALIEKVGDSESVKILRQTVGDIPVDGFDWAWKDGVSKNPALSGSVTLILGANASAEAKILPHLSYSFKGQAGISGNIKIPFSYGAFAVRGGTKGSAELQAEFNHENTTRVLTALANDLPIIANLANPQQLLNSTFASASLKLQGEVNLGATLTAGKSWVASLGSNGRSTATAEVTAGLEYGIDWARTGQFEIAIQPKRVSKKPSDGPSGGP